ncbi:MAG: hypothetical protein JW940_38835 [Polyangiaceae bacterium]|nr:hypothetical protein [Polyangiaceae bacterium]
MRFPRAIAPRDQAASAFSAVLMRLCDATGALAAALVDSEGETVDYAGTLDPYDIKVGAAEWSLVLRIATEVKASHWQGTSQIIVRAEARSFAVVRLTEGYAIVLQLMPRCFRVSQRALAEARREIAEEARLDPSVATAERPEPWVRIDVQTRPGSRAPIALWWAGQWHPLEILGRYARAQLARGELGYRARLPRGAEVTLVREPFGLWYADQLPDCRSRPSRPR